MAEKGESALEEAASKILAMIAEGKLKQTIDSTYEIREAKQAIERAFQGGVRKGKVLFKNWSSVKKSSKSYFHGDDELCDSE